MTAVAFLPEERIALPIDQIGAGRAFDYILNRIPELFPRSSQSRPVITLADPAPSKAVEKAKRAQARGIEVVPEERTGQALIAARGVSDTVLSINTDLARANSECLLLAADNQRPTCLGVFCQLPNGKLAALRAAFGGNDAEGKRALAAFFAVLDTVTLKTDSHTVWGSDAPPANILLEPPMRRWFETAFDRSQRMASGLDPQGSAIEMTFDGVETRPMFIRDSRAGWADRATLTAEIVTQRTTPMARGTGFVIAELGVNAIQLVHGKLRAIDGTLSIDAVDAVTKEAYDDAAARKADADAARRAEIDAAMQRAEAHQITALHPMVVTD